MAVSSERKNYFTKHLFRAGLQCPTKLYYYAHKYPQDQSIRPFLEHAGHNKYQLKGLLRGCFPGGIQIDENNYTKAFEKTTQYLKESPNVLYDAVFIHERRAAKIPVLTINQQKAELHFVQTKVINPRKHRLENHHGQLYRKWRQYIYDAAFQATVIKGLYPELEITAFLSLPDKRATARESELYNYFKLRNPVILNEDLFCRLDITKYVSGFLNGNRSLPERGNQSFENIVEQLSQQYFSNQKYPVEVGLKCKNCEFRISEQYVQEGRASGFIECWKQSGAVPEGFEKEPHIFDLIGPGVRQWVEKGIYLQKNVPASDLPDFKTIETTNNAISHKQRQALQVKQAKGGDVPREIVQPTLFEEINRWQYPLHFLDFEAGNYAVPIKEGRRPYHLVVFQFSCHTLHQNGRLSHHDWISRETDSYPNYALAGALADVPGIEEGTIIQYSNFERTALKTIRNELLNESAPISDSEMLVKWLGRIIRRHDSNQTNEPYLADLSRLVKNYYYNRYMADSLSIKDVVQSVLTLSEPLKGEYQKEYSGSNFDGMQWWQWDDQKQQAKNPYTLLKNMQPDVKVGRGTEAMVTFGKMLEGSLTGQLKEKAILALLQYCELDTLAMVMIYQHWKQLVETD